MTNKLYMELLDEDFEKAKGQEYLKKVLQNNREHEEGR
mgnify:CR=1 FL=1